MSIKCNVPTVKMNNVQQSKCPSINSFAISIIIYLVIIIIGCFNYYLKKKKYKNNKNNKKPKFFNHMKNYFGFGLLFAIFVYFYVLNKTKKEIKYNKNFITNLIKRGMDRKNAEVLLIEDHKNREFNELMRMRDRENRWR